MRFPLVPSAAAASFGVLISFFPLCYGGENNVIINNSLELNAENLAQASRDIDQLIARIVDKISSKYSGSQKTISPDSEEFEALTLLGKLRANAGVDLALKNIQVMSTARFGLGNRADFDYYPFACTLVRIGRPALLGIVGIIKNSDPTSVQFQLACICFKMIVGNSAVTAEFETFATQFDELKKDSRHSAALALFRLEYKSWESPDPHYEEKKVDDNK